MLNDKNNDVLTAKENTFAPKIVQSFLKAGVLTSLEREGTLNADASAYLISSCRRPFCFLGYLILYI